LIRWLVVVSMLGMVAALGYQRYRDDVAHLAPADLAAVEAGRSLRVLGRIKAGSLVASGGEKASFVLEGDGTQVRVMYHGPDLDTLRELKTVLVSGVRQPDGGVLAGQVTIAPNYGYIAAAYALVTVTLLLFAFATECRVNRIRGALGDADREAPAL
jgi:cytochrome c-type biogenesis protein CcmE